MKRKSIANRIAELNPINALDRLLTKHNQPTVGEPNGEFDDMFSHLGRGNGEMPDERVGAGPAAVRSYCRIRRQPVRYGQCRGRRPHHVQKDRIGSWEVSCLTVSDA